MHSLSPPLEPGNDSPQFNRLLSRLPKDARTTIDRHLQSVRLEPQQILYHAGQHIRDIYFPDSAVLCMLTIMRDGHSIESATVGSEGASWVSASLGAPTLPCQTMVSIGGTAHKVSAKTVEDELRRNGVFRDMATEYSHALLISSLRIGACNALHPLKQRCARWMLDTLDRTSQESFAITQEFLASLLGCGRPVLNGILQEIEAAGAIASHRGSIHIADRAALEKISCECYLILRENFAELTRRADTMASKPGIYQHPEIS